MVLNFLIDVGPVQYHYVPDCICCGSSWNSNGWTVALTITAETIIVNDLKMSYQSKYHYFL